MFEYVIWGKKPHESQESLLLTMIGGKPITNKETAKKALSWLANKHHCQGLRLQEINLSNPASVQTMFANSVNL